MWRGGGGLWDLGFMEDCQVTSSPKPLALASRRLASQRRVSNMGPSTPSPKGTPEFQLLMGAVPIAKTACLANARKTDRPAPRERRAMQRCSTRKPHLRATHAPHRGASDHQGAGTQSRPNVLWTSKRASPSCPQFQNFGGPYLLIGATHCSTPNSY